MNKFRIGSLIVIAVTALNCVAMVGTASAMSLAEWQIEGESMKELSLTEETVNSSSTGSLELKSKVLGSPFKVTCSGTGLSGKLRQEAKGELTLEWSGCTVSEPSGCSMGGKVTRNLNSQTIETEEAFYEKLAPASGETLMELTLTGCAAAGTYPLKGPAFCEALEETEEELVEQPLTYSEAISKAGGCGTYKLGKEAATISGEFVQKVKLAGPRIGKRFRPSPPTLCKAAPLLNKTCPAGEGYEGEVKSKLMTGEKIEIINAEGTITCDEATYKGSYRPTGLGTVLAITYKDSTAAGGKCVTTRAGEPQVLLTFMELPTLTSKIEYSLGASPYQHNGTLSWANTPNQIPLKIGFLVETCIYELENVERFVVNGTPGPPATPTKMGMKAKLKAVEAENGNLNKCPANLIQKKANNEPIFSEFTQIGGGAIYLTDPNPKR